MSLPNTAASASALEEQIKSLQRENQLLAGAAKQAGRMRELWTNALAELRATKGELEKSSEFLDRLLATTPLPILVLNPLGRIEMANTSVQTLFGRERDEIVGRRLLTLLAKASRPLVMARLRERLPEYQPDQGVELSVEMDSGNAFILETYWAKISGLGGMGIRFILLVKDISARRKAEEVLRLTQFSVDRASDALFWLDPQGRFAYVNDAACKSLGYTRAELTEMSVFDIDANMAAEHWAEHWRDLKRRRTFVLESKHLRRDGTSFPTEVRVNYLCYGDREYNCAFARDISERMQSEAEREDLNKRLLQASREVGMAEVASGVLHNVGNVLNSLNVSVILVAEKIRALRFVGLSQLAELVQEHESDLSAFITEDKRGRCLPKYMNMLADSFVDGREGLNQELASLTKHLEHIKQIVATQQAYAGPSEMLEPLSVAEVINDAITMSVSAHHRIDVMTDLQDVPIAILDRHKLLQVLTNLLRNARQSIIEANGERRLIVRLRQSPENRILVEIEDSGVGIPAERIKKIWEYGFTTKPDGHGIGLHNSANSVKGMGGSVSCTSEGLGRGATFVVRIPFKRA